MRGRRRGSNACPKHVHTPQKPDPGVILSVFSCVYGPSPPEGEVRVPTESAHTRLVTVDSSCLTSLCFDPEFPVSWLLITPAFTKIKIS